MPRQVDHDLRRSEVAEVACELIAREGVEATTVRRVAEAAKCSTTIVSHYFANKHQLLLFAYRAAAASSQSRVSAVVERDPSDLQGCLEALLPLDRPRLRDWQVWFAFWGMVVGDAEFTKEHRRYFRHAVTLTAAVMSAKWGERAFGDKDRCDIEARRLFALVSGLAAQTVFDPKTLSAQSMRDIVATEIKRMAPT
jgi:AcrR family transcriptional regulator